MFLHLTTPRLLCLDNLVVLKSAPCVFKSAHLLLIDCHRPEHSVLAIISSLSQSFVFKLRGRTQSLGPEQYVITFFLLSPVGNHPPNVFVFICIPAACVMTEQCSSAVSSSRQTAGVLRRHSQRPPLL